MNIPNERITFNLFGKERTYLLSKTEFLQRVEIAKLNLTPKMQLLLASGDEGKFVYYLLEAKLYIQAMIPGLAKELGIESLDELNIIQSKELVQVYVKEIFPALQDIYNFLMDIEKDLNEEIDKEKEATDNE